MKESRSTLSFKQKRRQHKALKLRELIDRDGMILAPGSYDAMSAKLVEEAGFPVVYMTGFGTAASMLGKPDVGLLTMSEMVSNASCIARAVEIPLIADADTGYGNPLNIGRTVREYENGGVSGIHIEDQVFPKKCGHMQGKQVIPAEEMIQKIRAAVDARSSKDFIIIARTDSRAVEGIDSAINRAKSYKKAGADVLFVEAPESRAEIEKVSKSLKGYTLLFNGLEGGKTPSLSYEELERLGFKIVLFPLGALLTAHKAIRELLSVIKKEGTPKNALSQMTGFNEFLDFIGLPEIKNMENRYGVSKK